MLYIKYQNYNAVFLTFELQNNILYALLIHLPPYYWAKIEKYIYINKNIPIYICPHLQPPFSSSRFISAVMVSYLWGQLIMIAIPEEITLDIDWSFLHWLIPAAVALGNKNIIQDQSLSDSYIHCFHFRRMGNRKHRKRKRRSVDINSSCVFELCIKMVYF